jgi:hypothetical protein
MVVDLTYETHGLAATYAPPSGAAVPDILLVLHQPKADQARSSAFDLNGGLSIAENVLTACVRSSEVAQPEAEGTFTFNGGKLAGQVFRLGADPTAHEGQTREWRLKLQKVA